jgi:RHS repeat-associated protein
VRCIDYAPFGEEIPSGQNGRTGCYETLGSPQFPAPPDVESLKFTGKERDAETGLDFFGARYLSSAQGRFTSPDWSATPQPIPYADLSDPQTLNLYTYVRNNPLAHPDLDGHCCEAVSDFGEQLIATPSPWTKIAGYGLLGIGAVGTALSSPAVRQGISDLADNLKRSVAENGIGSGTPETGSIPTERTPTPKDVYIDPNKYPAAAGNAEAGQKEGQPDVLTVQRPGTSGRRNQAVSGTPTQAGTDRDEYPPAVTAEGGRGARVRNIPSSDNRGAGASVGNQIRDVPNGGKIRIIPKPKPEDQQH